jgi:hypothetical protein
MNMLFKVISLSLILCLFDKFTLQAADLAAQSCPLLARESDDSTQQRSAAAPMAPIIDSWSQIPQHLRDAKLSLEGIALSDGHSPFSYAIKASTLSKWSHVGLLVRDTRYCFDNMNGWYVFESIASPSSIGTGPSAATVVYGVRLANWQRNLASSDDVTIRHLHYQNDNKPSSDALKAAMCKYIGRPYEQNVPEMVGGVLEANVTGDSRSIFCSELNALVLQDLGLLPTNKLASNFMPAHFSLERHSSSLPLIDAHLGREHVIRQVPRTIFKTIFESATGMLRFFAHRLGII